MSWDAIVESTFRDRQSATDQTEAWTDVYVAPLCTAISNVIVFERSVQVPSWRYRACGRKSRGLYSCQEAAEEEWHVCGKMEASHPFFLVCPLDFLLAVRMYLRKRHGPLGSNVAREAFLKDEDGSGMPQSVGPLRVLFVLEACSGLCWGSWTVNKTEEQAKERETGMTTEGQRKRKAKGARSPLGIADPQDRPGPECHCSGSHLDTHTAIG